MKKLISVAMLCTVVAVPAFAEDAAKTPAKKMPAVMPSHPMGQKCDADHAMGSRSGMMSGMGGMMGSEMMEPDMHMLGALNLSDEQRSKITKLSDEFRHDNWPRQGLMNDETAKLRDLYQADRRDPAAIGNEYQKIFDLKRQMIEAYLDVQNHIEDVLTAEQRAKMKEFRGKMHRMYMQH